MKIDWAALGIVAGVSVVATLMFVFLLSLGIRFVSAATANTNQGGAATASRTIGYAFTGCAGLLVLFCLYLIIPQFH